MLSHQSKMEDLLGRHRQSYDGQKRYFPQSRVFRKRLNHLNLRTNDKLYERYRFRWFWMRPRSSISQSFRLQSLALCSCLFFAIRCKSDFPSGDERFGIFLNIYQSIPLVVAYEELLPHSWDMQTFSPSFQPGRMLLTPKECFTVKQLYKQVQVTLT